MKFSKLSAIHRTALANLANAGPLRTDKLAKGMGLGSMSAAAHELCAMRKAGLIFSKEKGTQVYAEWEASLFGRAVFDNRPAGELVGAHVAAAYGASQNTIDRLAAENGTPTNKKATAYAVVPDTGFQVGTYDDALECAKAAAIGMGKPYIVIALVAEVLPPVAPQPVVNVL